MEFRTLKASEIQVRPTDTKTKGRATLLLYQDARCAMDILDETVGNENWQKEYYDVKGNVYCKIGIFTSNGWTWKSDCGTESNMDAEKGEASDAFKRAAVCWGIGRELYSGPKVKVSNLPDSYYYNDKLTMTFSVKSIAYVDKKIASLTIVDRYGKEVFNYGGSGVEDRKPEAPAEKKNTEILRDFCSSKKKEEGVDQDDLLRFYNWYYERVDGWDNVLKPQIIWDKWLNTKRVA